MNINEQDKIYYIDSKAENAGFQVSYHFARLLREYAHRKPTPLFVCIGSDRVTGDSLGPLIGSELRKALKKDIPVYGTLEMPVHALNLEDALAAITLQHPDHLIIAIDASLGTRAHQGYITMGKGSIQPGAGVDKALGSVGDIFITGIIGVASPLSHLTLQTTRLSSVIAVAEQISAGILQTLNYAFAAAEIPVVPRTASLSMSGLSLEASR